MSDEHFKIFVDDFLDYLNSQEAIKLKEQIARLLGVSEGISPEIREDKPLISSWNPARISQMRVQGSRGEFEKSEDVNNPEFKAMLKDLANYDGKLMREGWFYWVYKNGTTVDRKRD